MIQLAFNTGRGVDKQKALKTYILEINNLQILLISMIAALP